MAKSMQAQASHASVASTIYCRVGLNPHGRRATGCNFFASNGKEAAMEHMCYYPKDSELCLTRVKPQETVVEARSRCDVQIHDISQV